MKYSTVKNRAIIFVCICITAAALLCGCGSGSSSLSAGSSVPQDSGLSSDETSEGSEGSSSGADAKSDLTGQTLVICCNSAYKDAISEITVAFESNTHVKADLILGSDDQLTGYIQQHDGCDILIPGSVSGYSTLSTLDYVKRKTPLLERKPVIAVPAGNPYGVQSIRDLGHTQLKYGFCNPGTTQIGRTARKILTDKNIAFDSDNITMFLRESDLVSALRQKTVYGGILWSSDADAAWGVDSIAFPEAGYYAEKIPVITLSTSVNNDPCAAFIDHLEQDDTKAVWEKYHFSVAAPAR